MNNLNNYLANKCLETASIELSKQTIAEDKVLSPATSQNRISIINTKSAAKNLVDVCKILSGKM